MTISHQQVYESIATMLNSGLDIKKSLHTSVNGADKELHDAVIAVKKSAEKGDTLARAFIKQSRVFPLMDRTLVDVGEKSGRLPDVFQSLADWYRFKTQILMIIKSGLMRPILLLVAAAFIIPLPTIFTDSIGKYIFSVFILLTIFFLPACSGLYIYLNSGEQSNFRKFTEKISLRIPLVGNALWNLSLGRYCFGFWMMFESGVPVEKCTQIAADLCGNHVVAKMLAGATKSVKQGNPVSDGFSSELPGDFISIWKVGEESGRLGETLIKLYKKQIEKAEYCFLELSQWIPRAVYALVVLFFVWYILGNVSVFIPKL